MRSVVVRVVLGAAQPCLLADRYVAASVQELTNSVCLSTAAVLQVKAGVRMPQIQPASTWMVTGRAAAAWQLVQTAVKPAASAASGWGGQDTAGSSTQHW